VMPKILLLLLILFFGSARAQEQLLQLPIEERLTDSAPVLQYIASSDAVNLILIPGGNAGTGEVKSGVPSSLNFLVRSRSGFQSAGFNTFILFRAKSVNPNAMSTTYRADKAHLKEIESLVNYVSSKTSGPIWIVGTSMGTISATSAALNIQNSKLKGLVLTASVTRHAPGNLGSINLKEIKIPVLMVHHADDQCFACVPNEAKDLFGKLSGSAKKEFQMVSGGGPAMGDPCQNQHWHGFLGIEEKVVDQISQWIKTAN